MKVSEIDFLWKTLNLTASISEFIHDISIKNIGIYGH